MGTVFQRNAMIALDLREEGHEPDEVAETPGMNRWSVYKANPA